MRRQVEGLLAHVGKPQLAEFFQQPPRVFGVCLGAADAPPELMPAVPVAARHCRLVVHQVLEMPAVDRRVGLFRRQEAPSQRFGRGGLRRCLRMHGYRQRNKAGDRHDGCAHETPSPIFSPLSHRFGAGGGAPLSARLHGFVAFDKRSGDGPVAARPGSRFGSRLRSLVPDRCRHVVLKIGVAGGSAPGPAACPQASEVVSDDRKCLRLRWLPYRSLGHFGSTAEHRHPCRWRRRGFRQARNRRCRWTRRKPANWRGPVDRDRLWVRPVPLVPPRLPGRARPADLPVQPRRVGLAARAHPPRRPGRARPRGQGDRRHQEDQRNQGDRRDRPGRFHRGCRADRRGPPRRRHPSVLRVRAGRQCRPAPVARRRLAAPLGRPGQDHGRTQPAEDTRNR